MFGGNRLKAIASDKLTLSDLAGNHLTVDPMKFRKTVYQQETNEIAVGDRLRWTRNDKELGRRNGQEFVVTAIEGQTAFIQYLDAKSDRIDLSQPLHLDYALVSTTYSSQGKTADRVLISSTVDPTVSQESVYVAISRAKHDLKIFAEDRSFLFEQAQESNAQETVLELLPASHKFVEPYQQPPAKSALQPLVLVQNPTESKEQINDFHPRQSKSERAADSRDSSGGRYRPVNRENHPARSQPDREFERIESQSLELFAAISRHLELQEVEQLGAFIAEIDRNVADGCLRGQGTEKLTGAVDRQDPASLDSPGSNRSIERQENPEQRATRQLLNALTGYLEVEAIAESTVVNELQTLTDNLALRQSNDLIGVMQEFERAITKRSKLPAELQQRTLNAISEFVEESSIETALTETIESLTEHFSQDQHLVASTAPAFGARQSAFNQTTSF